VVTQRFEWLDNRWLQLAAVTALLILAAALRCHALGAQSFWNDEGSSYVQALRPFMEIADNAGRDIHPPGYYWLLGGWRLLAGTSEFALRALSVFASLMSIAFTYALGRRLFGGVAGLTAALLVALNSFSIYYAQEARMYALLALWAAAAFWALAAFLRNPNGKWAIALALFNAAGLWTQYAYPFVMLAQGVVALVWMWSERRLGRSVERPYRHKGLLLYIGANLLTIALYLPWLPTALRQLTSWPNTGDSTPFDAALGTLLTWLSYGMSTPNVPLAIPLLLALFGLLYVKRDTLWEMLIPAAWAIVPPLIFLVFGLFRLDNVKLLLPSQLGMALLVGRGVWVLWTLKPRYGRLRDRATRLAQVVPPLTAALSVLYLALGAWDGVPPLYDDPAYQRANYRAIAQAIDGNLREGDAVILDAPNQEEVFRYYYTGAAPVYPLPQGLGGDDAATGAEVEAIIGAHERAFVVFWGETERDPQRIVETTLDQQAFEVGETWYGDVRLARYVMPVEPQISREANARFGDQITLERYALSAETLATGDTLQVRLDWRTDAALTTRYKVFLQLLDANGVLAAQRDSEPGGGLTLTTTWIPGETIPDQHALLLDVPSGDYTLIVGLYELDNSNVRLPVGEGDYLTLGTITVTD
jgi:4-amino-4-deoxy-L-arabinose transferase-like glycosyltransferase